MPISLMRRDATRRSGCLAYLHEQSSGLVQLTKGRGGAFLAKKRLPIIFFAA